MTDGAVLAARNITRTFGDFVALENVDFAVGEGEIVALLGENGAGKSTLMNVLSGAISPTGGTVLMDDAPVTFRSPMDAAGRGIGMVHQHFLLVPTVSVAENLLLTASRRAGGAFSYNINGVLRDAQILAGRLGWTIPWNTNAGDLPVGTQQRVEIIKALRGTTRVLIFDEPTAVLTPTETPELFATIRRLSDVGHGIVFISHKLDEVMALAHRVVVLRRGKVVFAAKVSDVDERILAEAMVGADSDAAALLHTARSVAIGNSDLAIGNSDTTFGDSESPADKSDTTFGNNEPPADNVAFPFDNPAPPAGDIARTIDNPAYQIGDPDARADNLVTPADNPDARSGNPVYKNGEPVYQIAERVALNGVSVTRRGAKKPALDGITFTVGAGEIFGVAGVDGNGQEELAAVLSGLLRPTSGVVTINGATVAANPAAFRRAGVAVIPADRQARGLAMPLTLTENVAFGVHDSPEYRAGFVLRWRKLKTHAAELIRKFDIRGGGANAPVSSLSGGNQQKVVIARALSGSPKVVVAVNPTRGLDVGAIAYVHNALRTAQKNGAAVVLISTELDEVRMLSTRRVAVLFGGRFTGIVAPDVARETFGMLMGGKRGVPPIPPTPFPPATEEKGGVSVPAINGFASSSTTPIPPPLTPPFSSVAGGKGVGGIGGNASE